jgi:hypothetical protein
VNQMPSAARTEKVSTVRETTVWNQDRGTLRVPISAHGEAVTCLALPRSRALRAVQIAGRTLPNHTARRALLRLSQLIDPHSSQGEQIDHTNFAMTGEKNLFRLRGTYSEGWTPFWITAHFLAAAAEFERLGVDLDKDIE